MVSLLLVPTHRLPDLLGQLIVAAQATPEAITSAVAINPERNSIRLFIPISSLLSGAEEER